MAERRKGKRKKEMLQILIECEDRGTYADLQKVCRQLRRQIEQTDIPRSAEKELLAQLQEMLTSVRQNRQNAVQVYVRHIQDLISKSDKSGGGKMGLFGKVTEKIAAWSAKKENAAQNEMLQKARKEAEKNIFFWEKRMAELYDKNTDLWKDVNSKIDRFRKLPADCNEAKQLRQQIKKKLKEIEMTETQLDRYGKMLEDNATYNLMIQMGQATIEMKQMMPDLSKTEAMLEWIKQETESVNTAIKDIGEVIDEGEKKILQTEKEENEESTLFDDLVREKEGKQEETEKTFGQEEEKGEVYEVI